MAAGDVRTDGDGDEQPEAMGDGSRDEAGRGGRAVVCELVEGHARALASEHEDEGRDKLGQRGLQGIRVRRLVGVTDCDVPDRHGCGGAFTSRAREASEMDLSGRAGLRASTGLHFTAIGEVIWNLPRGPVDRVLPVPGLRLRDR